MCGLADCGVLPDKTGQLDPVDRHIGINAG
jgi:hypothetical protein